MPDIATAVWRYLRNASAAKRYRTVGPPVSGVAARVLNDLDRRGIAITSVEELFPSVFPEFSEIRQKVAAIERQRADEMDALRSGADEAAYKSFIFTVLGDKPTLDLNDPFARFLISEPIIAIANGYMRLTSELRYFNVWHTLLSRGEATQSQLWHRDPEDHLIVKLFVYLSDVDEGAGPLSYAPGTHPKGSVRVRAEVIDDPSKGFRRSQDWQMARVVPPEDWVTATGKIGTIVFADTRGYHKGGFATDKERVMLTGMFTSPSAKTKEHFERPRIDTADLSRVQRLALNVR